jgi:hypothetical protein
VSRFTSAYSSYVERSDEVLILVRKASQIERSKEAFHRGREIDALCRGSIVLLSSHLEAYVKELGECLLDALFKKAVCRSKLHRPFFYHASRQALDRIRKDTEPQKISEGVFDFVGRESSLWAVEGSLPRAIDSEQFNKGFSNPKFDKIQNYLGRFGYQSLRHDLNVALKKDCAATVANIDQIVETRNSIAHGEASATRTPAEVKEMVHSAQIFCRTIDASFAAWCKTSLCAIR